MDSQTKAFRFFPANYFPEEYPVEEVENMPLMHIRNILDDKKSLKLLISIEEEIELYFASKCKTEEELAEEVKNLVQVQTVSQVGEFLLKHRMEKQLKELSRLFQLALEKEAVRRL